MAAQDPEQQGIVLIEVNPSLLIRWKFRHLLNRAGISAYRLTQEAPHIFTMSTVHRWLQTPPKRPDLLIIGELFSTLYEITGVHYTLLDLIEYVPVNLDSQSTSDKIVLAAK